MKMAEWNLRIRIKQAAERHYEEVFPDKNTGAGYVLETWPLLYRSGLEEVAGQFSMGELSALLEALKNASPNPESPGRQLLTAVREGIEKDRLNEKWEVKSGPLLDRLMSLTRFQCAVLELWAAAFWRSDPHPSAGDLERAAAELA